MFAEDRRPEKKVTIQLKKETFYPALIKGAIHDIVETENIDVKTRLSDLAFFTSQELDQVSELEFWTSFRYSIYAIELSNFDQQAQNRIRKAREYVTNQVTRLEDMMPTSD